MVGHQLYVEIGYFGDWRFYNLAADETATVLNMTSIDRHVGDCSGGCSLDEAVGIDLDESTLREHSGRDYAIKLSAKSGDSLIITVPSEQIRQQLAAIDHDGEGYPPPRPVRPLVPATPPAAGEHGWCWE